MDVTSDALLFVVPGLGMLLVSVFAVVVWRRAAGVEFKWFWAGAGLWAAAVALKVAFSVLAHRTVVDLLRRALTSSLFLPGAGLYLGAVSAAFELGLTWLAARRWRRLGCDPGRAIAVGVGAGAVEGLLLGLVMLGNGFAAAAGEMDAEDLRDMQARAAVTSLFWLVLPTERVIALLGHASTRALVLLGVAGRRPWMVFLGFTAFTLVDGVVGAFSHEFVGRSMWWLELAVLPFNLAAVASLVFCLRSFSPPQELPLGMMEE
jgi:hypothetical protein